jgi:hypothetical protein
MLHNHWAVKRRPGALMLVVLLAAAVIALLAARGPWAQAKSAARPQPSAHVEATVVSPSPPRPKAECGKAAPEELAQTIGGVAAKIYAGEVASSETIKDRHQVETYVPLLQAVAKDEKTATENAVTTLVYSHTHIVRLRVLTGKTLLADVGGPYILAPLSGTLRLHGRTVGRYVMSVQDDVGYVKIESRFIGAPVVLRTGAKNVPIEYVVTPGPVKIPDHGPVTYKHVVYQAYSFKASAFPSGPLRISVLVPLPAGLSSESCSKIRSTELALVARRISGQLSLSPGNFQTYVNLVRTDTRGLFYVYAGSRQLAGSTRSAPARLPLSGTVSYHGGSYEVFSFQAPSSIGKVRIYELYSAGSG